MIYFIITRKIQLEKAAIKLPKETFGTNTEFKKARAVVRDHINTLSAMLIRKYFVGKNLENFNFEYKKSSSISTVNSSNFFLNAQKYVRLKWGESVNVLPILVSSDKTELTKCGKRTIWPIYVTCGKFSTEIMTSEKGSQLSGFCPYIMTIYINKYDKTSSANMKKILESLISKKDNNNDNDENDDNINYELDLIDSAL